MLKKCILHEWADIEPLVKDAVESGDMTLEDSLALFEEGVRLSRLGSVRLDEAERRVERLLNDDGKTATIASPEKENEGP